MTVSLTNSSAWSRKRPIHWLDLRQPSNGILCRPRFMAGCHRHVSIHCSSGRAPSAVARCCKMVFPPSAETVHLPVKRY